MRRAARKDLAIFIMGRGGRLSRPDVEGEGRATDTAEAFRATAQDETSQVHNHKGHFLA